MIDFKTVSRLILLLAITSRVFQLTLKLFKIVKQQCTVEKVGSNNTETLLDWNFWPIFLKQELGPAAFREDVLLLNWQSASFHGDAL